MPPGLLSNISIIATMNADTFSFARLRLLWRFYTPAIRRQAVLCGGVLLLCYLICLAGASGCLANTGGSGVGIALAVYSFGAWIVSWLYFMGPLVFGFCGQRRVVTTLPASWLEKSVFVFGYVFVVYPLFLAALWYGAMGVASLFTVAADVDAVATAMLRPDAGGLSLSEVMSDSQSANVLGNMMSAAFMCFVIASSRRNRVAHGVVAALGIRFVIWLSGVVAGVYAVFSTGFLSKALAGEEPEVNPQALVDYIDSLLPVYSGVCTVMLLAFVSLTVLKIKNRQN